MIEIQFYFYNTCAACHPEEEFYEITKTELLPWKETYPYIIYEYNTFHEEDKKRLKEQMRTITGAEELPSMPVVILGNRFLSGMDAIQSDLQHIFLETAQKGLSTKEETLPSLEEMTAFGTSEETKNANIGEKTDDDLEGLSQDRESSLQLEVEKTDSVLLYFSTLSCEDCSHVKEILQAQPQEYQIGGTTSKLVILEKNIMEEENVWLLQELFSRFQVPKKEQLVPIVFYRDGYISGAKALEEKLPDILASGAAMDLLSEERIASLTDAAQTTKWSGSNLFSLAAAGFVNGLNPCGASMLFMLLAALAVSSRKIWKIGLSYLLGKFIAYLSMGLGFYRLLQAAQGNFLMQISRIINGVMAACMLVFAVLYLIDFFYAMKKEYGKVRMQLPRRLRSFNHRMIEACSKVSDRKLLISVFGLGILISAGEFFCTGQVYLAAILYMLELPGQSFGQTVPVFVLYVTMMCIPSVIFVFVVEKTNNVLRMSNTTLRWMPAIKLLTAIVFLLIALFILF